MTHTTDKNYREKHEFEPSGTYSDIGKELCECGLPLDIPTIHYYKSSTDTQKENMKISKQKLIQALEKEKQTDEWVNFGENKLMRKQHQVGFNKAIDKVISLVNSMKGEE